MKKLRFLLTSYTLLAACGDSDPNALISQSGSGAGAAGQPSAGSGGASAGSSQGGSSAGGSAAGNPGAGGMAGSPALCAVVEAIPEPSSEAPFARLMVPFEQFLWLVSGTSGMNPNQSGGVFRWAPGQDWQAFANSKFPDGPGAFFDSEHLAGFNHIACFDDCTALSNLSRIYADPFPQATPIEDSVVVMSSGPLQWSQPFSFTADNDQTVSAILFYPNENRARFFRSNAVKEQHLYEYGPSGAPQELPLPEGNDGALGPPGGFRWTAAQRWYVRSGQGFPLATLDLDASVMHVLDLPPLDADAPAAVDGSVVWLFGKTASAKSVLYRVDAAAGTGEEIAMAGLPSSLGKPWHEARGEETLLVDGEQLWLFQAKENSLQVFRLDPTTGSVQAVKLGGDAESGRAMYRATQSTKEPDMANGFRPGDTLKAIRWAEGEAWLLRQWGPFRGVRLTLGCAE